MTMDRPPPMRAHALALAGNERGELWHLRLWRGSEMSSDVVFGIDPGVRCGLALYDGGKLSRVLTFKPHELLEFLHNETRMNEVAAVVFEDSRLQSHVWAADGRGKNTGALKIARNVGMVDAICAMIEGICEDWNCVYYPVSPKNKGAKMDRKEFEQFMGVKMHTNQHERDAAMVAYPYRHFRR